LPSTLKTLQFEWLNERRVREVLHSLQDFNLTFPKSLASLKIGKVNGSLHIDGFLETLLLDACIPRVFSSLREIDVSGHGAPTTTPAFRDANFVDRLARVRPAQINRNICRLNLRGNPILLDDGRRAVLLQLLHRFEGITNLGVFYDETYPPEVERVLRRNWVRRSVLRLKKTNADVGNTAAIDSTDRTAQTERGSFASGALSAHDAKAWPVILELSYKRSPDL